MSQAGFRSRIGSEAGFTLFELLVVMVVLVLAYAAVTAMYTSPSRGIELKSAARLTASRLRDLRAEAMTTGTERGATVDVNGRLIKFGDGRPPLMLGQTITLAVTGAESETGVPGQAGVRFYPNGSSSGATIELRSERQQYEVRVNWLTGRV
jgi:general secretion pathway protein H